MLKHRTVTSQSAFTLVELSIVLVILGLLIGGVLTGQSLIRAAELRSVTTQFQRYQAAVNTFKDKYFALPGDMTNAQTYWGVADPSAGTCITTASTTAVTCNGNGDGLIAQSAGSNEMFRFWQHLANAGLIEGSYDGVTHGSNAISATTANSPSGRLASSLWYIQDFGTRSGDVTMFDDPAYGNSFEMGGSGANATPAGAIFKPEELYNIDTKLDDGKPATGKVRIRAATIANCTDTSNTANMAANYLLSSTALCGALIFKQPF